MTKEFTGNDVDAEVGRQKKNSKVQRQQRKKKVKMKRNCVGLCRILLMHVTDGQSACASGKPHRFPGDTCGTLVGRGNLNQGIGPWEVCGVIF